MLVLDMELLSGLYRASLMDGSAAEWPPHPERVFSALVDTWAALGQSAEGKRALEWLERQEPPSIQASVSHHVAERNSPTVYVPPNDPKGDKMQVLPEYRPRQARVFRASRPDDVLVRMEWPARDMDQELFGALQQLAASTAAIGHSSSLVRCQFRFGDVKLAAESMWEPAAHGAHALRMFYPGRLADLEYWYSSEGKVQERPRSRRSVRYQEPGFSSAEVPSASVFADSANWFVFEGDGGRTPDVLGLAHVTYRMRAALLANSTRTVTLLSGHQPDGAPAQTPHVAFVPLLNVGHRYSTGDLLAVAVVIPTGAPAEQRRAVLEALGRFAPANEEGDFVGSLNVRKDVVWRLCRSTYPSRKSLRPERYSARATRWASVTPVLLDRFPKRGPEEEAEMIAAACQNIGLPQPIHIEIHKHSAVTGAPTTYPARGARSRPDWVFPNDSHLARRVRRHVVLQFERPVQGGLLLGAGRYQGFGLCLPLSEQR